jgi:hypothetical protein
VEGGMAVFVLFTGSAGIEGLFLVKRPDRESLKILARIDWEAFLSAKTEH